MANEITITIYSNNIESKISLADITREQAQAYELNRELIAIEGFPPYAVFHAVGMLGTERVIDAIYDSDILYDAKLRTLANYYIEATDMCEFIKLIEEECESWFDYISVTSCSRYAKDNLTPDIARFADCIDLDKLGDKLATYRGLYVTEDKHVVKIY